jgi:putative transposase
MNAGAWRCGRPVSSTQVSRTAALLDEVLEAWRRRPLGDVIYLNLDARYEKVRLTCQIRDVAIPIASGVGKAGKGQILGLSVSLSEAEVHWRAFLQDLVARGMQGVQMLISDDHARLENARRAVPGGVPWQRCHFHLQQNEGRYIPRKSVRKEVAEDIRTIFQAPDRPTAEAYLAQAVAKYARTASKLPAWMEESIPEGLRASSPSRKSTAAVSERRMDSNGSVRRSSAGREWWASSPTKQPACGW